MSQWCVLHRREFPAGQDECVLCGLVRKERLQKLLDVFPKRDLQGRSKIERAGERRMLRRRLGVRKYTKRSLIERDAVDRF